jgi:hypothetical protein
MYTHLFIHTVDQRQTAGVMVAMAVDSGMDSQVIHLHIVFCIRIYVYMPIYARVCI